jgi:SAM-dependent methyltransferase
MTVTKQKINLGSFSELYRDRSGFHREFVKRVIAEPGIRGRVLDIGCGAGVNQALTEIAAAAGQLDGADPNPEVRNHPALTKRWCGTVDSVDLPDQAYDLAYSYNVVEHVSAGRPFFESVKRVLKPGGVFWALTPHGRHPFCSAVKFMQLLKIKQQLAKTNIGINSIPSYYRLNKTSSVLKAIDGIGFKRADFFFMPCTQWDLSFPKFLRWAPNAFDWLIGTRAGFSMLILMYRLEA